MNLNFSFYKRQQRYQSHKWNTHSHTRRQNCHNPPRRPIRCPKQTLPQHKWSSTSDTRQNQLAKHPTAVRAHKWSSTSDTRQNQLTKRPTALRAHKWSSTSDTRQNQLAKRPTALRAQKTSFPGKHRWTYSVLELVSLSRCMFPFHQRKAYVDSQCRAGEKQGGSPKHMVSAAARSVSPKPPLGASEPRAAAPHSHPGASSWRLCSGKPREPDVARVQQPQVESQKL